MVKAHSKAEKKPHGHMKRTRFDRQRERDKCSEKEKAVRRG
jgi:hypothetical protein